MSFSLADISQFESLMSSPPQECIPVHNVDMSLSTVASISGIPSIVSVCEILSKGRTETSGKQKSGSQKQQNKDIQKHNKNLESSTEIVVLLDTSRKRP